MRLTSTANPVIKYVRSLGNPARRRDDGVFLIEGVRLVGEAVQAGVRARLVLYVPEALQRSTQGQRILDALSAGWAEANHEVDDRVMRSAADTEHPGGVAAVIPRAIEPPLHINAGSGHGLILDGVSDPGNAGTILRAADAFGARYVVTTPGGVDLFAPKVVRAGMGAHFRLPVYSGMDWDELLTELDGVTLVAAAAGRGVDSRRFRWPDRAALMIGGEAEGLTARAMQAASELVHIPMKTGVESLNAAMAAAILLYSTMDRQNLKVRERYI